LDDLISPPGDRAAGELVSIRRPRLGKFPRRFGGSWLPPRRLEGKADTMKTGMLWFDSSTISASAKIFKGVDYFYKKYGKLPDLILLHPSMTEEKKPYELELRGIGRDLLSTKVTVRQYRPVLPGHIWIGIADKDE
jgi:hypothetical protein